MARCLEIAALGQREVSPNPMVGCVIAKDDKIIAEGYHEYYGGPHAEVNALTKLKDPTGSTLYVSLEPCSHFGKTPPCTEKIIASGIKNVVIGAKDPVNSGGADILKERGIHVITGVLEQECKELNKRFFCVIEKNRPYIILKWAESADGFIAPNPKSRVKLSSDKALELVHKWRTEEAGILVGSETVLIDNPKLTPRLHKGRAPARIALDRRRRLLARRELEIFRPTAPVLLFGYEERVIDGYIYLYPETEIEDVLKRTASFGIDSVIVEGGGEILKSFLAFADEYRVIRSKVYLKDGVKSPLILDSKNGNPVGDDIIISKIL